MADIYIGTNILESVVTHPTIFDEVMTFLTPDDILRCAAVNRLFKESFLVERIWKLQCNKLGYSNYGTKSRKVPYISVYRSRQCIECFRSGTVVLNLTINLQAGSLKPALCTSCFNSIMELKWTDRIKLCLLRVKKDHASIWSAFRADILCKVPEMKSLRGRKRPNFHDVDYDGAFHNDYLVKGLRKKPR